MPRPVRPAAPASPRPSTLRRGQRQTPAQSGERTALSALTDGQLGRWADILCLWISDSTRVMIRSGCARHLQRRRPALLLRRRLRWLLEEETQCVRDGGEWRQLRELKGSLHGGPRRQGGQGGADCGGRGWAVPGLHAPAAQAHVPAHQSMIYLEHLGGVLLPGDRSKRPTGGCLLAAQSMPTLTDDPDLRQFSLQRDARSPRSCGSTT